MKSIKHIATILALGALPVTANAAVFEFAFEGYVDRTNAANNDNVVSIGDLNVDDFVSGSFTFDGAGHVASGGTTGSAAGSISDFDITIDGFAYSATGLGSSRLYDNHMPGSAASVTDAFFANSGDISGPDQGGLSPAYAQFSLGSIIDLSIISSLGSPSLLDFQNLIAANTFDGNTNFLVFGAGDDVRYSLTSVDVSVAPVPLPAAGVMLIASLGALGAMKRRKKS